MGKINLFWAIVWGVICAACIVAAFWNPLQIVIAGISGVLCSIFRSEYDAEQAKEEKINK